MIILIPAYEPDHKLLDLIAAIRTLQPHQAIVIVDDGSGSDYASVFDAARFQGCDIVSFAANHGKGIALKAGFRHIAANYPGQAVVCADCDGQHRPADIATVAATVQTSAAPIVLGARTFAGDVPLRSRFGNSVTRVALAAATSRRIEDTQTGLRGYSADLLPWLESIPGERFEYELNVLLRARSDNFEIAEVEIATVYLDHNASSHFRPIVDSFRIYAPLLKFCMSSLLAFAIDFVAFVALIALGAGLAPAVIGARLISATINFFTNRRLVFGQSGQLRSSARRYVTLALALLAANYGLMWFLVIPLALNIVLAKVITESVMFTVSFATQQRIVFADRQLPADSVPTHGPVTASTDVITTTLPQPQALTRNSP